MSNESSFTYVGSELDLFREAKNWRRYWSRQIEPFIGSNVLEVGAGNGTVTRTLLSPRTRHWVALEPDAHLASKIEAWQESENVENLEIITGTLDEQTFNDLSSRHGMFDTIIYIDVLEHIEDDRNELVMATKLLDRNGKLLVLVPAHMYLFSPFDDLLGHYRRYDRESLERVAPPSMQIVMRKYLDSAGMLLSLGNRVVLRKGMPSPLQIRVWDRFVVRLSTVLDRFFRYRLGKSLVIAWRKSPVADDQDNSSHP